MKRELRRVHRSRHHSLSELNITPLLDLVFVLLVIFIITTPQLTNNLELTLPSGIPTPQAGPKSKNPTVFVSEQGGIILNDQAVTPTQLKTSLERLKHADPELGVVVRGSGEVDFQKMIDVLDLIHQLDIIKVGLSTDTVRTTPE
jgi:biopolymer transport protein ExbD